MKKAMKKIAAALVFGAVTMVGSAAFAQIPAAQMAIGGVSYGASVEEVEAIYGKPLRVERKYKNYGEKLEYKYANGLEITFINGAAKEIDLEFPSTLQTAGGIAIGSDEAKVREVYGEPDLVEKDGDLVYRLEGNSGAGMKFDMKFGKVTEIECGDF